jgi:hypothetical protein
MRLCPSHLNLRINSIISVYPGRGYVWHLCGERVYYANFFWPTIPILAWAFGCPVLTSDIRGIREQAGMRQF